VYGVPLHPALVHVPLGLAFILPFLALAAVIAWWRGWATRRAWAVIVALQLVLLGAGLVVKQTGEREARVVRRIFPRGTIRPHSQAADYFVWGTGVTLVIAGLGLALKDRKAQWAATVATVATFGVATIGVRVGHLGGQLVYQRGAAMIYTADSTMALEREAAAERSAAPPATAGGGVTPAARPTTPR
jgi:uncharacterized membrane protein